MDKLREFEERMIACLHEDIRVTGDGHRKSAEPNLVIGISNDMTYWAEIYSYRVEYVTSGRRHDFFSKDLEDLFDQIDRAIRRKERELGLV